MGPDMATALADGRSVKEGPGSNKCFGEGSLMRPVLPVNIVIRNLSVQLEFARTLRVWTSAFHKNDSTGPGTQQTTKRVLNNVSARFLSGSITAVIGASGSGKTTLLSVLSQRTQNKRLHETGEILYNGNTNLNFVRSAFVMQQDVLVPTLTVREVLEYAAQLQLPLDMSVRECLSVVEEIVIALGLQSCANTRIGNEHHRGCSGGEKRRVSLGIQMLANPSVLFLDEITTGLDAASAFHLVKLLKAIAMQGRTIIMTIHQPRSEIWELFDDIVLLAEGTPLYSGTSSSCLSHFGSLGYPLPPFVNPAEHVVDLAAVDSRSSVLETVSRARVARLKAGWVQVTEQNMAVPTDTVTSSEIKRPSQKWILFARRVKVQTARTFKTSWRDPNGIAGSMVECIGMGILTGWIFYDLDGSQSGIRSREGAIYISVVMQSYLVLLYETYRLTLDIEIFDRERMDGVVDAWSFLVSRRIAKFFTEDVAAPLIYSAIVYFMVGFRGYGVQFLIFFCFILLSHHVSVTLATVAVALCRDFAGASLIVNMNLNLQALCSGFLIQTNQIPVYVRWLKWLAYAFYATGALITNEFIGKSNNPSGYLYDCPFSGLISNPACAPWTGRFIVDSLGYPQNSWIWRPAVIIICSIGVHWIGAGLLLTFFKPETGIAHLKPPKQDLFYMEQHSQVSPLRTTNHLDFTLDNVALDMEKRRVFKYGKQTTTILNTLNVTFKPGVLNVIMGVSGGGKSSLLNLMARRLSNTFLTAYRSSGHILLGGSVLTDAEVHSFTSYVCQSDDALISTLTVREMLVSAAQLRLPASMTSVKKTQRAEQVIHKLGLRGCADTVIGSHKAKGISGGEKRRLSIAIQVLAEPRVLLLDEPTSGLDAFAASSMLDMLRNLAEEGCTVIMIIHQPRSDHFRHFGSVLLLAQGGCPVYSGPAQDMIPHFSSLGFNCPENMNPADFALDLINLDFPSSYRGGKTRKSIERLTASWISKQSRVSEHCQPQESAQMLSQLLEGSRRQRTPILYATRTLLYRSGLSFVRSRPKIIARTAQVLGFTVLVALFYAPLQNDYAGVQSYVGLLQEILAVYFIGMLQNVAIFPDEHTLFSNEHHDGVYGVEPFFLSYTILGLPFDIVNSAIVGIMTTFAIGLPMNGAVFGVITLACFGLVSCGESVGMIFNTLFYSTGFAVSVISVLLSLGLVMSGVLSTGLTGFLGAINHLSPAKWATAAMARYTLSGQHFTCTEAELVGSKCPIETGEDVLTLYSLNGSGPIALIWLAVLVVGYRLLAYVLLKVVYQEWSLRRLLAGRERVSISKC